jgi:hypothetical protein
VGWWEWDWGSLCVECEEATKNIPRKENACVRSKTRNHKNLRNCPFFTKMENRKTKKFFLEGWYQCVWGGGI